ncbi:hypothetical protein Q3G72_006730 [Acer saccharum]|nr:hypothetical protein Q3G72_006730 [Acer saccharum]
MFLAQTTQLLGYGWAGLFRKYLVDSPYMWWPANLVQVSLFRALHEKEERPKGGYSKLYLAPFFAFVYGLSFATLTATISHVALFDGSDIWKMWKKTRSAAKDKYATTNQQPGLNVITELIIGYMYPGKPLANVAFKTYGYISMTQALSFLSDFKLGHYMKIPPKSMFIAQLVGTIVASTVYFCTAWIPGHLFNMHVLEIRTDNV